MKEQVSKTEPENWVLGVCWDWRKIQKEKQGAMADRLEVNAVSPMDISPYQKVYNAGKLDLRVTCYFGSYGWGDTESLKTKLAKYGFNNLGDDHLRWRGAKFFADGGIGSMDGALSEPYLFGKPNNYGALAQDDDKIRLEQFQAVADRGWEIHTCWKP